MNGIPIFYVDAFADRLFAGNPAAVCPLDRWIDDATMQSIAFENNLSETAFFVKGKDHYAIRWFTPEAEVDLCGHATLASAHVLLNHIGVKTDRIFFSSQSGELSVFRRDQLLYLDFPSRPGLPTVPHEALLPSLGGNPVQILKSRDYLVIYENEQEIRELAPDFVKLRDIDALGIIVTAPSVKYDFVSRFFAPGCSVDEDPVTGSAHCTLIPYWAERLGKTQLRAYQASKRGGELHCQIDRNRVNIGGSCVTYMTGSVHL